MNDIVMSMQSEIDEEQSKSFSRIKTENNDERLRRKKLAAEL